MTSLSNSVIQEVTLLQKLNLNSLFKWTTALGQWRLLILSSLLALCFGRSSSANSLQETDFQGKVISRYDQEAVSGIIIEIQRASGEKVSAGPTDADGLFSAKLNNGEEYSIKFFKALSIGNALISSQRFKVTGVDGQASRTFAIPISATTSSRRGFEISGKVLEGNGAPFNGILAFLKNNDPKSAVRTAVISGKFRLSINAADSDKFAVNAESENGNILHSAIYELSSQNWNQESHIIQLPSTAPTESNSFEESEAPPAEAASVSTEEEKERLLIKFEGTSDSIDEASQAMLNSLSRRFLSEGGELSVRGHAPSHILPLYDLTQRRVLAVVSYLEQQGIDRNQIHYSYAMPTSEDEGYEGYLLRVR